MDLWHDEVIRQKTLKIEHFENVSLIGEIEKTEKNEQNLTSGFKLTKSSIGFIPNGVNIIISSSGRKQISQADNQVVGKVEGFDMNNQIVVMSFKTIEEFRKITKKFKYIHFIIDEQSVFSYVKKTNKFHTIQSAYEWVILSPLLPFIRTSKSYNNDEVLIISSRCSLKNLSDAKEIAAALTGASVVLSHSSDVRKNEELGRAVIEQLFVKDDKITIQISSKKFIDIWADTDIWMFPIEFFETKTNVVKQFSSFQENVTQCSSEEEDEIEDFELSIENLLAAIGPWQYLNGIFRKLRQNEDGVWKNVYATRLKLRPVDENVGHLVTKLRLDTILRLSINSKDSESIIIKLAKIGGSELEDEETITVNVIGFESVKTKIPLSRDIEYFLHFNELDLTESDNESCLTEETIIEGYSLVENLEEICDELGKLQLSEWTIKSISISSINTVDIRLSFVLLDKSIMKNIKSLEGRFVRLYSSGSQNDSILAFVSKIIQNNIILTVKGVHRDNLLNFEMSQNNFYHIEVEKNENIDKEAFVLGSENEGNGGSDMKFVRFWQIATILGKSRSFCQFYVKHEDYENLENGKLVLIAKCWEIGGVLMNKSDFVYAVKSSHSYDEHLNNEYFKIEFEILNSNNYQPGKKFTFSKAYYFVEVISPQFSTNEYKQISLEILCCKKNETTNEKSIQILPIKSQKKILNNNVQNKKEKAEISGNNEMENNDCLHNSYEVNKLIWSNEEISEIGFVTIKEYDFQIDKNEKEKLYLYIDIDNDNKQISHFTFIPGKRLYFALDHCNDKIKLIGHIFKCLNEKTFVLQVDFHSSNMDFVQLWLQFMMSSKLPTMPMLCFEQV